MAFKRTSGKSLTKTNNTRFSTAYKFSKKANFVRTSKVVQKRVNIKSLLSWLKKKNDIIYITWKRFKKKFLDVRKE